MDIKLDDLQTFMEIYKEGSFTKASKTLGISQSALSQKISRLEQSLQSPLFIRHPRSLELTSSGEKLLIYAKEMTQRHIEFLNQFNQDQSTLGGVIRIAGFSSIMRSITIPKFANFIRKHPKAHIEFSSHEMFELEQKLKSNAVDFIITDFFPNLANIISHEVGEEEYVIIESRKYKNIPNVYLDHGPYDNATVSYFSYMQSKSHYDRRFMGDVYSIVDGVALGLGRAVMSKHIIENDKRFKIIKKSKRYIRPIVISYFDQEYYSPLFKKVLNLLISD